MKLLSPTWDSDQIWPTSPQRRHGPKFMKKSRPNDWTRQGRCQNTRQKRIIWDTLAYVFDSTQTRCYIYIYISCSSVPRPCFPIQLPRSATPDKITWATPYSVASSSGSAVNTNLGPGSASGSAIEAVCRDRPSLVVCRGFQCATPQQNA